MPTLVRVTVLISRSYLWSMENLMLCSFYLDQCFQLTEKEILTHTYWSNNIRIWLPRLHLPVLCLQQYLPFITLSHLWISMYGQLSLSHSLSQALWGLLSIKFTKSYQREQVIGHGKSWSCHITSLECALLWVGYIIMLYQDPYSYLSETTWWRLRQTENDWECVCYNSWLMYRTVLCWHSVTGLAGLLATTIVT